MLELLSTEELANIPTLVLPLDESGAAKATACHRCEAYRPDPQASGNLQVDPEIHLPSVGMDLDIAYYYNATSAVNGPFGYSRTASPNLTAQASGSPALVTLTRGNGSLVSFQDNGSGTFVAQTPGLLNRLTKDVANSLWKETTPDGIVTAYPLNTTGQITSLTFAQDAVGNTQTFAYASGLLQTIQDAVGRKVTFGYSGNLLSSIQDWAGRRTTFQYDTATASPLNLLTTVTGPTGCQTAYQYATFTLSTLSFGISSGWLLSGIVDPNGYGTSYTYDRQKRVVTRTVAGVGVTTYLYQPSVMLTVDVLGNVTTQTTGANFSLSSMQNPLGALVTFTRNANNQETSRQTPTGAVWTTLYDGSGNVSGRISPLGQQTTFSYDGFNNLTSVQTPDGAIVTNIWGYGGSSFDTTGAKRRLQAQVNQLGFITTAAFNARGQVVSMQNPLGFLSTVGYDGFGNPVTQQDALGNVSTRVFDLAGNVIGQTNPLGATWSTTFDNQNRPLTSQDPLGNLSTVGYDSVGNKVVAIDPLGFRTSWSFNVFDKPVKMVDALGNVSTTVFDGLGRTIASSDHCLYRCSGQSEHGCF
jgi:YD repeat-containing protein